MQPSTGVWLMVRNALCSATTTTRLGQGRTHSVWQACTSFAQLRRPFYYLLLGAAAAAGAAGAALGAGAAAGAAAACSGCFGSSGFCSCWGLTAGLTSLSAMARGTTVCRDSRGPQKTARLGPTPGVSLARRVKLPLWCPHLSLHRPNAPCSKQTPAGHTNEFSASASAGWGSRLIEGACLTTGKALAKARPAVGHGVLHFCVLIAGWVCREQGERWKWCGAL